MFKPLFAGPYLPFDAFFHPINDTVTSIHNVDAVFLPTAEFTLPVFMNDTYIQAFPRLQDLRIYAVVHRPSRNFWQRWSLSADIPEHLAAAISQQRLTFLTLAPHVTHALQDFFRLPRFANLTVSTPQIFPFVPVIPNVLRQDKLPPTSNKSCNRAVLQGANRADDFLRVQEDLLQELRASPHSWGYKLEQATEADERVPERYIPDANLRDTRFTLFALGRGEQSNPFRVLEPLEEVVKVLTDLPYDLFWPLIANCDVMLTGWPLPTSRYIRKFASSTIPTALMNRLPVLLSRKEYRAYNYLDSPAILEIRKDETEIQALARLRRTKSCQRGSTARWEKLERRITVANQKMLEKLLLSK